MIHAEPLDEHVLRCLGYMHDIEYQTVLYTRELLMMPFPARDESGAVATATETLEVPQA